MRDPDEGIGPDGTIVTGVRRERVPPAFAPVVAAVTRAVEEADRSAALYLYGSVATGQARVGASDVDLMSVGLPAEAAAAIGGELSRRFADVCRGVEIGPAAPEDFVGDADRAYGNRVFRRHYCVPLGATPPDRSPAFPADARAARGFNGDVAEVVGRWRERLDAGTDPGVVASKIARKTLFAMASLLSVREHGWTTDRATAAERFGAPDPAVATLVAWADFRTGGVSAAQVGAMLEVTVEEVVTAFTAEIGLWAAAS